MEYFDNYFIEEMVYFQKCIRDVLFTKANSYIGRKYSRTDRK